ncbi:MAG: GTP 3',8-cyclase MoaA, partial [Pseudomonadota bacterium]
MLTDNFGRLVNYLRLSVTDRCDFRCVYCMAEDMQFVPRQQLLTIEEMAQIARVFVNLGVKKIRITGGEPLIRRNIIALFQQLGRLDGLDELTLTSNGSQLRAYARQLVNAGVGRINISLDSLNAKGFRSLTRTGELAKVLDGIEAALEAGLKVKLNSVILKHRNGDEVLDLVAFALNKQMDISFIEEMPLGVISEHQRNREFISSESLRALINQHYSLQACQDNKATGGPSRYWQVRNYSSKIGFISPHSDNFCGSCN